MSTLHDRLSDIADQASGGTARDARTDELWRRGRRYGMRRRAGAVVFAVAASVALGAGAAALGPTRPAAVQPADRQAELRLPDRLYHPDPWTAGTSDTGPVGPVVAVLGAPRASWGELGEHGGLAAVTSSGEYAFLDLDDRVGDIASPSPDGRYVAYWFTDGRDALDVGDGTPAAAGIAVLDTITGDTVRHPVDAPLGLMTEDVTWTGERLWVPVWAYDQRTATDDTASASSALESVLVLDPSTGETLEQDPRGLADLGEATAVGDRVVLLRQDRVVLVDASGERETAARLEGRLDGPAVLDPTGTRIALLRNTDRRGDSNRAEPLLVGALQADLARPVSFQELPGPRVDRVVAWRSPEQVVTVRYDDAGAVYESVDVVTGERRELLRPPSEGWDPPEQVARDALSAPTYDAAPPPSGHDPRLVLGAGIGLAVALTILGTVLVRRRVRA